MLLVLAVFVGVGSAFGQARIQPKDTLRLICAEEPGLNKNYQVTDEGVILVNFLGAVEVKGLTEAEAAAKVKKQLEDDKILPNATIRIEIVRATQPMVKFEGAVNLEAETPWREGMRLSDVVRLAEPNAKTDLSKVMIVGADGNRQTVDYSIADLQTNVNNPFIKAGDTVRFAAKEGTTPPVNPPTDPVKDPVVPPQGSRVAVSGEVVLGGEFPMTDGMTVADALVRAGGFTALAEVRQVVLVRGGANRFIRLPDEASTRLMAGDTLNVLKKSEGATGGGTDPTGPTDPIVRPPVDEPLPPGAAVVVLGGVANPGKVTMVQGMRLSDAIKAAGGFADGARIDRIRVLSPGNAKPRTVNFRDIELRYTGDILLRPGQTIEIPDRSGAVIPLAGSGS